MKNIKATPFILACIAGIGMFISTLDASIINIAIPSLAKAFDTTNSRAMWTITSYSLLLSASIIVFGHLADRYGRLKLYKLGLLTFAISSLLCGIATSLGALIVFRGIQGLSAAMMQATAIALVTSRLKNKELAKAMSMLGVFIGLGPMLGPPVGGMILSTIGWRWLFFINIPICATALYACKKLSDSSDTLHLKKINYINAILLAIAMLCLFLTMDYLGHGENNHIVLGIITVITLIIYVLAEIRSQNPVVVFRHFKKLPFNAGMLCIVCLSGTATLIFMLLPIYFHEIKAYPIWQVGLISLATPTSFIIASKATSKLANYLSYNTILLIGAVIALTPLLVLTQLTVSTSTAFILLLSFIYGIGIGMIQTPAYIYLSEQFPEQKQGFISSLIRMVQNLARAFSVATSAMLLGINAQHTKQHLLNGINHSWWFGIGVCVITIAALIMNYKSPNESHNEAI